MTLLYDGHINRLNIQLIQRFLISNLYHLPTFALRGKIKYSLIVHLT